MIQNIFLSFEEVLLIFVVLGKYLEFDNSGRKTWNLGSFEKKKTGKTLNFKQFFHVSKLKFLTYNNLFFYILCHYCNHLIY